MVDKFIVIDGNSLANRAFYAIPMLSNSQGFITNAVYGFCNMLFKLIEDEKPRYIAVAFDKGKIVFRHQEFPDYKAQRKGTPDELRPQFPVLKELLRAMNIAIFEIEGYEADDIIGTLVKLGEGQGFQNLIVTGDRDALQLVSPSTQVLLTRKGITELETYDDVVLKEKYGLSPQQMIDLKGLMGDASDNIPGIPGVGEKTALKLLHSYGDIEKVLAHWEDFKGKKLGSLLVEFSDQARLSKKLATIYQEVPLEIDLATCLLEEPNYPQLMGILKELEFKNILQNVMGKMKGQDGEIEKQPLEKVSGILIDEPSVLEFYLINSSNLELSLYMKTEKDGIRGLRITALGIKLKNVEPVMLKWNRQEDLQSFLQVLRPYLEDHKINKTLHDVKLIRLALEQHGVFIKGVLNDTLLMAYLLNPSRSNNNLIEISGEYLNKHITEAQEDFIYSILYSLESLSEILIIELRNQEMYGLYQDLELPLSDVLVTMEKLGIRLNGQILSQIGTELEERIQLLTEEIYDAAGEKFNINSPKQLGVILFEKLQLPKGKKTKTGYSTSAEVLESLALEHQVVAKILFYRHLTKLKSTYIDGLQAIMDPDTQRVYTSLNQAVTATGRLSSTEPNLQNIPIRMEEGRRIRKAFLPSPGNILISADYSQIELRVLAHIAKDEVLMEAFHENQDIHTRTAAEVFGVPMNGVTKDMRRAAKAVNFGIVYGISDFGLGQDLGISRAEAKEYIEKYFLRYNGVKRFIDSIVGEAREKGYVTTILNRRRYLPDILSRNFHLRSFAERTAMNTPIQGSAADIIKLAMLGMQGVIDAKMPQCSMILQVHDELIFDVPSDKVMEMGVLVNEIMSQAYPLAVPLKVDLQYGPNWYELEPLLIT